MIKCLLLALAVLLAILVRGAIPFAPVLVNEVGSYSVSGTTVSIYPEGEWLNYSVEQTRGTELGPARPSIVPGSGWFAYIESPSMVWVFTGDDVLMFHWEFREGQGGTYMLSAEWDTLPVDPPRELIQEFPESMQRIIRDRAQHDLLSDDR